MQGKVKWFNAEKGFGFISMSDGRDVFVHHSVIQMEGYRKLIQGETVEFDVDDTDTRGPRAINVTRLEAAQVTNN